MTDGLSIAIRSLNSLPDANESGWANKIVETQRGHILPSGASRNPNAFVKTD